VLGCQRCLSVVGIGALGRVPILMPPCGSSFMTTTNSVPLPVSELSASSETITDERRDYSGDAVRYVGRNGDSVERGLRAAGIGRRRLHSREKRPS
jgi:hypothetical protein